MSLEPVRKTTAAVQIAESIREALLRGDWKPGDGLPSERDLARTMGVNRSTIREALHRLAASGLVEIKQGGATRVSDFLVTGGLQLLPLLLSPRGQPDRALLGELLEMRTMILGWTARAVARARPSEAQLARLEQLAAEIGDPAISSQQRQHVDFEFFDELMKACPNRILQLLVAPLRQVHLQHREIFVETYAAGRFVSAFHRLTVEAIARGDDSAAGAAMEAYGKTAQQGDGR
jgi:DNA-binding FadR family transcriptional regulator